MLYSAVAVVLGARRTIVASAEKYVLFHRTKKKKQQTNSPNAVVWFLRYSSNSM
jgi:hypothetical protein